MAAAPLRAKSAGPLIILVLGAAFVGARAWVSTPKGRLLFDDWKLRLPVFGKMLKKVALARFARSVWMPLAIGGLALFGLGQVAPPSFMAHFTVFVLSCFIGYMVIWNVSPTLHTPLMSGANAISGITLVGAVLAAGTDTANWMIPLLGLLAVIMATVNVVGGFAVTHRMLAMFRRK